MRHILTSRLQKFFPRGLGLLLFTYVPTALSSNLNQNKSPTLEHPVNQVVEAPFESRREGLSRMTWKLQRLVLANGTSVLTLAGLQFEEALGLSLVIVDPPPAELFLSKNEESKASGSHPGDKIAGRSNSRLDIPSTSEQRLPGEPAKAEIQLKNILVELPDPMSSEFSEALLNKLPPCDKGRRRAIAFVRPEQTARQLAMNAERAGDLTRYGRAACVGWDDFPPESDSQAKKSPQNELPPL